MAFFGAPELGLWRIRRDQEFSEIEQLKMGRMRRCVVA